MTPAKLTEVAQSASQRYVSFLNSLRGLLSTVIRSDPSDMRTRNQLRSAAFDIARTYLNTELQMMERDTVEAAESEYARAHYDAGVALTPFEPIQAVQDSIDTHAEALETEMRAQIERDVSMLLKRHRDFQMEVQMIAMSENIDMPTAQFRAIMRHSDQVRFFFVDRSGRKYPSQKFIRTVYRDAMLQIGNETYMITALQMGFQRVRVVHPEPGARANEVTFPLNPSGDEGGYTDIRGELFHPNSNSVLRAF